MFFFFELNLLALCWALEPLALRIFTWLSNILYHHICECILYWPDTLCSCISLSYKYFLSFHCLKPSQTLIWSLMDMRAQRSRIAWSGVEYNAAKDDLPERCSSCIKNIDDDDDGDEHNSGKLSFGYILLSSTHANSPWNTLHFHSFKSTMWTVLTRPLVLSSIGMIVYLYIFLFY